MIEIDFNAEFYSGFALDAAVKVYADYATCELDKTPQVYKLRLTATGDFEEQTIADELSNYALGATIEERQPEAAT